MTNQYKDGKYMIEVWAGGKWWYFNDLQHREDGHAVELINGEKYWFLNGREYTEKKWKREMRRRKLGVLGI